MVWHVNCKRSNGKSIWENTKKFINSLQENEEFTRRQFLHTIYTDPRVTRYETTADHYRNQLTHAGFIGWVSIGIYRKIENIPKDLNTTNLRKFARDKSWRTWFMTREDRLKSCQE